MTAEARRRAFALAALMLATFTYVTTETLPIGVLPGIARSFDVRTGTVGLLVGAYALVVVIATVPLARLTARVPRRRQLLAVLVVLTVGNLGCTLAPSFGVLAGSRVLVALGHALFWAVIGPAAAALARPEARGRALATVFAGQSIGVVVGTPLASLVGGLGDWRAAFAGATVLGAVSLVIAAATLPRIARADDTAARGTDPDARRYMLLVLSTALVATASLLAFTYVTPFLIQVSGVPPEAVSALLVVRGSAGLIAVVVAGRFVDRHAREVMLVATGLLVLGLAIQFAGGGSPWVAGAGITLLGGAMSAFTTALGTRVLAIAPGSTDVASGGTSTAFNVGIMAGSSAGGALLPAVGLAGLPAIGAAIALVAFASVALEPRLARRAAAGT